MSGGQQLQRQRLPGLTWCCSVKVSHWAAHLGCQHGQLMYDLASDPQETRNLAADPAHAALLKELSVQHAAWQKSAPAVPALAGVAPLPKAEALAVKKAVKVKRKDRAKEKAPAL